MKWRRPDLFDALIVGTFTAGMLIVYLKNGW